ncbi:glucosamine-6-phosphate deaminase [Thermovenabulum gondwanense]|uniref:glucosamine-6-phosphate deaminase n=1 Tax=Thermovenabulum gondwanense TaxID=520767 RepID=UPI00083873BD|nr:glucosamine-6-phosphate deaminase [Thermovenabulum gondwanense]
MKVIVVKDYAELSKKAALFVVEEITKKPDLVLGLATGNTPLGMYQELVRLFQKGKVDFSKVVTFNLDEYVGLSPEDKNSYHYYMFENFFKHINIPPENIHIPNGIADDIEEECRSYDEEILKYERIDLQILGIGINGHIGFNEPGDELITSTHVTELSEETRKANSKFFENPDEVPRFAITMGLGTIMKARKILLLASGREKAKIIAEFLGEESVSTKVPASFLLIHPDVTCIIDEEAAQLIKGQG